MFRNLACPASPIHYQKFPVQALKGEPLTVYGHGNQTRSFCYVDDMVDGLIRLMSCGDYFTGPLNLGNPSEFTILQLARLILELTGSNSEISYRSLPQDNPKQRKPEINLAKKVLSWKPKVPLIDGLQKTISYFDDLLRNSLEEYDSPWIAFEHLRLSAADAN